jgi:hypothetical protein
METEVKVLMKESITEGIEWVLSLQEKDLYRSQGIISELQISKGKLRIYL